MSEQTTPSQADESEPQSEAAEESEPAMVELYVDTAVCVGMGMCEVVEPTVFEINDDAISVIIGSALFPADRAEKVMFECPSGAIKVKD